MNRQAVNSPFSCAANTSKHNCIGRIVIKFIKGFLPVFEACGAVNPLKAKAVILERQLDQVKHFGPTTENDASDSQLSRAVVYE